MRILYDDNMPYAEALFSTLGDADAFNHQTLHERDLSAVEALMIRSTTKVDAELLAKMPRCRYLATATAGTNHIDYSAVKAAGIAVASAAGCNAEAVAEYAVAGVLAALLAQGKITLNCDISRFSQISVGVIGVGQVGRLVVQKFTALGCIVHQSDPPRADAEQRAELNCLDAVLAADVICCHAPLVRTGAHPSWHILDASRLAGLRADQILLNAGRGEIIDNAALLSLKACGKGPVTIFDVWENEPDILLPLIEHCFIATPHIAGHSLEGKARGSFMLYEWLAAQIGAPAPLQMNAFLPPQANHYSCADETLSIASLKTLVDGIYDIAIDHSEFVANMAKSNCFAQLRKHYRKPQYNPQTIIRREFAVSEVTCVHQNTQTVLKNLGFSANTVL
jgi:erythronate-4-phosphate dehydrogenase